LEEYQFSPSPPSLLYCTKEYLQQISLSGRQHLGAIEWQRHPLAEGVDFPGWMAGPGGSAVGSFKEIRISRILVVRAGRLVYTEA
jgi:hypothetical protein